MKRRQLFEFQDQAWFPDVVREGQVEILSLATWLSGMSAALAPAFERTVEDAGGGPVLDLCSGAGGPVVQLAEALARSGRPVPRVLLSDLYPNPAAWRRLQQRSAAAVDFVPEPVDATRLPARLPGRVVTIVNGLHHFPPRLVRAVVEQVTGRGAALFVAEGFTRSFWRASALGPAIGVGLALNPLLCQRGGLAKALLSGPLPVLTATGLWDWIASAMRIHEGGELCALGRAVAPDYRWEHGVVRYPPWGRAVWCAGLPAGIARSRRTAP